ncbi:hypothetical protein ACH4Q7_22775 [Streptomyces roseolus]|uniref:hypothetical protein n=1 Tax=Streptomyces roseolus TaxID=67358 RepID=UPI00379C7BA1
MDDFAAADEPILTEPRQPLLTYGEAVDIVMTLRHFADSSEEGKAAGDLAHTLAMRIPAAG